VAQTLLTDTETNYFNALYDFKIAKAVLYRAIGQDKLE
jgi:outer membrane protein TolC